MSVVDVIILAAILAAVILATRSLRRSRRSGSCASCSSANECEVARMGKGSCPVAERMVSDADEVMHR